MANAVQDAIEQLARLKLPGDCNSNGGTDNSTADQQRDWQEVAQLAETCANSLRSEQARTELGNGTLISTCSECLKASSTAFISPATLAAQTQLCRIIGNAVLDHPQNRQVCLQAEVPQRILDILSALHTSGQSTHESEWLQAIKACTGALLNLSIDTPHIASLLYDLQALQTLGKNLALYKVGACTTSGRTSSTPIRALIAEWSINLIKEVSAQEGADLTPIAIPLVTSITSLPVPNGLHNETTADIAFDSEQAYTLVSADLSILSSAAELLESGIYTTDQCQEDIAFASDGALLKGMAQIVESAELLPAWLPIIQEDKVDGDDTLEAEKTFNHFKADVARIIIGVCSNDKVMGEAFKRGSSVHWLLAMCVQWLQSRRSDLIITGSTILANLARSDDSCTTLVQDYDMANILSQVLDEYLQTGAQTATTRQPGEAMQVLHGVVGLLKNLAIPGPNKQSLSDAKVIEPCLSILNTTFDMIVPLQNAAVGVLKHLCAGNISSSLKVILPPNAPGMSAVVTLHAHGISKDQTSSSSLDAILSLISRTNDVRLQCEATRLLVNIVRSLYSSRSITSPVTPSALGGLEMGLAKAKARGIIEHSQGVVDAISEIVRTGEKYPMLVNEGIVALTLLSTTETGAQFALKALTAEASPQPSARQESEASGSSLTAPEGGGMGNENAPARSMSRAVSLNPKNAPNRAMDVLVRWLNSYAIAARDMPAELAGNALSLIEGVSRLPGSERTLPIVDIVKCLESVLEREVSGTADQVLKDASQRTLARLRPS